MHTLECQKVSEKDCDFVAEAQTADELIHDMFHHWEEAHPDLVEDMGEEKKKMFLDKMHRLLAKK